MKLKQLQITNFRHLKDLDFDFTYQSGERKGQTLDKICIIGQSATGKTSILELVKEKTFNNFSSKMKQYFDGIDSNLQFENELENSKILCFSSEILNDINFQNFKKSLKPDKEVFSLATNDKVKEVTKNILDKIGESVIDFDKLNLWNEIFQPFVAYQNNFLNVVSNNIDSQESYQKIIEWKAKNPSPIEDLSEKCINPVFSKLNLEVDTKDTTSLIVLKPKNSEKGVPANVLSTGTKQLLLTALPIYALSNDQHIIMIDEPERSLYPDIQIGLIDYYRGLAPNAQFIVATHSPFIAAAFEPDERFILYFDNNGNVQVKRGSSPRGDDPNDMLVNDFGLQSIINNAGEAIWNEYLELKRKMLFENDKALKAELLDQVEKLEEEYNF
ncbi:MAG TPA: AAA family ATPase [Saprospiraceae bacterium]|nr:AAA family ATPase [Saprospiraceae bacterium]HMU03007.1 AAA family ATPase [Saprospiraceae bacterium]